MLDVIATKRFRILRRIGEGGMGEVYEAIDDERHESVALKVLRKGNAESLVRFKREFRAMQDLHHPNLITLGELMSEGDTWFFSMELVRGVDFVSWVGAGEAFDEARLRQGLLQLTHGLVALHEAQMIHRDVKPSNVLVNDEGRVVVLDFGLVAEEGASYSMGSTTEVAVVGTPTYMAPEQAASRPLTAAADWYAVGVMLYEALTGAPPFVGAPLQVLLAKQKTEPLPPSSRARNVPPDLDALCSHLLRFDPNRRGGAAHILRALDASSATGQALRTTGTATHFTTFVGRDAELETLRGAYADAVSKHAVTVLIHGESGIGKSCLVRQFAEEMHVRERDLVVLGGRCFERESVPYKAFDGVIDSLSRFMSRLPHAEALGLLPTRPASLAQLFPVLRRVEAVAQAPQVRQEVLDPQELRSRAFSALREVFTRLTDRRRVILAIDDLQWADADSIALLAEVLRPPEAPNLLLVATLREGSDESTQAGRNLLALATRLQGDVRHVHLGPLTGAQARALATALIEKTAPGLPVSVETIASEAAGHPLFIDEIVRHLFHVGAPSTSSLKLEEALWSRIEALDERARRLVELLAVAGAPIAQDAVSLALDVQHGEFAKLTSFLRVAHLVRTSGARGADTIEPYHSRVRGAVLANLDQATRRAHHRKLAVALETSGSSDEEAMAAHWEGARVRENAAKHMLKAAEYAGETLAFDRAAKLYERALALRNESTTRVDREAERMLERRWADALSMAGRGALAAKAYRAAALGANAAEALDLKRRAAEQLLRCGHFDEGLTQIQQVLASVGMSYPTTPYRALFSIVVLRVYLALRGLSFRARDASDIPARDLTRIDVCWSVAFGLGVIDPIRSHLFQLQHLVLALRSGESYRVARAFALVVTSSGMAGTRAWRRTESLIERASVLAQQTSNLHALGWTKGGTGVAHYLAGHFKDAVTFTREGELIFRAELSGSAWEIFTMRLFALQALANLGRMKDLCDEQPAALREASDRGDLHATVHARIGYLNLVWLVAGHPDMARRQCLEAIRQWSNKGFHVEHYYALLALTNIDLYEGNARAARDRILGEWPALERSLIMRVQFVRIVCWQLRARATLATAAEASSGERGAMLRAVERDARRIERERAPWAAPGATLLRAGVAALRGADAEARARLESSVKGFEREHMELFANVARLALGGRIGGSEGRSLENEARGWMAEQTIQKPDAFVAIFAPGLRAIMADSS